MTEQEQIHALAKDLVELKHRLGAMEEAVGVLTLHAPQNVKDAALEAQKAYYALVKNRGG